MKRQFKVTTSTALIIGATAWTALAVLLQSPLSADVSAEELALVNGGVCFQRRTASCFFPQDLKVCGDQFCTRPHDGVPYACPPQTKGAINKFTNSWIDCDVGENVLSTYEVQDSNFMGDRLCWRERFCEVENCVHTTDGKHRCSEGVGEGEPGDGAMQVFFTSEACQDDPEKEQCPPKKP